MLLPFLLLLGGCQSSADYVQERQEQRRQVFDSVNNARKEAAAERQAAEEPEGAVMARKVLDSFLNETAEGRSIKEEVKRATDSLSAKRARALPAGSN